MRTLRRRNPIFGLGAALIALSALAGCAGRYGSMRFDNAIQHEFEAAQVLPGYRYYTTGSEIDPAAIVALRVDRPLRGAWREIDATPALLKSLADTRRRNRPVGPDGAAILDDKGERIGVWYSYFRYPPPPRLLDDGGVELNPPIPAPDGDGPARLRDQY